MKTDADRIAELEDENRLLRGRVEKLAVYEPRFEAIEGEEDGSVTITFENAKLIKAFFAEAFVTILRELSAENYVETGFEHPDGTRLTVRVQRYLRKTPHQFRLEAEAARDAALARAKDLLEAGLALAESAERLIRGGPMAQNLAWTDVKRDAAALRAALARSTDTKKETTP